MLVDVPACERIKKKSWKMPFNANNNGNERFEKREKKTVHKRTIKSCFIRFFCAYYTASTIQFNSCSHVVPATTLNLICNSFVN